MLNFGAEFWHSLIAPFRVIIPFFSSPHSCLAGGACMSRLKWPAVLTGAILFLAWGDGVAANSAGAFLVYRGQAQAVIVAGNSSFNQFTARELVRYIEALSGAKLEIVSPDAARRIPKDQALILVGGPDANDLVREAAAKKLVRFDNLKPDGFVLRTIQISGHRALVAGGNDEAATLYAAYELIERYGAVFLITGDVLPQKRPDLELLALDLRIEPAFTKRGIYTTWEYENRSTMSLPDWYRWLDQMAKLKFNYLHLQWYPYEPWLRYEYHGEVKWMGDVSMPQSGYMLRHYNFGEHWTSEMEVGRDKFKAAGIYPGLAPPEFQNIREPEQAFEIARNFLRQIIDYARSRKIQVWLGIDATSVAPNLGRFTTRTLTLPFDHIFATLTCPDNPISLELNEARLKSLIQTYPHADGFFMWMPETYPVCNHDEADRQFYLKLRPQYLGEGDSHALFTRDITRDNDQLVDSNSGSVYFIQKLLEARDRIAPQVKLGVAAYGRLYLWPYIDKMFPKDVPFDEMESSGVWTPTGVPMNLFDGMRGRENTIINRIDDDSNMLGMQFNVHLYDQDQVLISSEKYGVTGFASQAYRDPETDWNIKYMSEGGYNAHLTPQQFYQDYATRIFGPAAAPHMMNAFDILEKNEQLMGWGGRGNFGCCGPPKELTIAYELWQQPNYYDGPVMPDWQSFVSWAHNKMMYYHQSIPLLESALAEFRAAQADAAPQSKERLTYLSNRTEAYILHLQTLIAWEQAYIDLDAAFQMKPRGGNLDEFTRRLDASLQEFTQARKDARATADKWVERIDYPASDLGVLYRFNTYILTGTELTEKLVQNIDNFYHGHDYLQPIDFGKVFAEQPLLQGKR
jgi:hypothetical protein